MAPSPAAAQDTPAARAISINAASAGRARDRMPDFAIGADYPGVLGREESLVQLATVQEEIGFRYIRFHAIFHDDMGVYREVDGRPVYDWTRIDALYDRLLALGLKPFVELGFTPHDMRTSDQTIFHWRGNTSHPEPEKWTALVEAFTRHLIDRYGREEVRTWFFEFWNEPNLASFWEGADQTAYLEYYGRTARAIKAVDPELRIGGPATAGIGWVTEFLSYADAHDLPVDFVSGHSYGTKGGFLDENGEADVKLSANSDEVMLDLRMARHQVVNSSRPGLPIHITEWSASFSPRDPIHDDYISASYILDHLHQSEGLVQSMSYWTFSDLFEETGPQTLPFQGGFGLLNPQGVRKPAFFAYKYLNSLGDRRLDTGDSRSIAAIRDRTLQLLAWRYEPPVQDVSDRSFYTRIREPGAAPALNIAVSGLRPGSHAVRIRRVGFEANDAHTAWLAMGSPPSLTTAQVQALHDVTTDAAQSAVAIAGADGKATISIPMRVHDVVLVEIPDAVPAGGAL
ncbi:beta-xylosidase [Brevundimonas sp. Root1423]|nr:beta-xylosidase [Brevundimonas sp. Root1423]